MAVNIWPMKRKIADLTDCCPVLGEPLDGEEAERLAGAMRVLADPARIRLLSLIASGPDGEACVCNLVEPLGLGQPTVSHHLKVLHQAGLLDRERRGRWVYYRVRPERLEPIREALAPPPHVPLSA
jgi:ArsR family transcriptional regulator, arsenate/arsenite/antimonite-responsive transcriptional repressor